MPTTVIILSVYRRATQSIYAYNTEHFCFSNDVEMTIQNVVQQVFTINSSKAVRCGVVVD